ncbi:hypothetical protein V7114_20620 [Neobacillus niacini]|uniref:phage tail assembly chaperone G n=1 Tax=Neobacillus niacini TaxID=86668 RepID=UPI003000383B
MKSLTLLIDGQEKKFNIPFVSGMVWRKWIELQEQAENIQQLSSQEIDGFVNLVVYAFKNQFTLEEFYEGIPFEKVMSTIDFLFLPETGGTEGNGKK